MGTQSNEVIQPILVMPVYRGGVKFGRALDSLRDCEDYFKRIVISLNGPSDSQDVQAANDYVKANNSKAELICANTELPWMQHQYFWLEHLSQSGATPTDWIYWFAHDDEVKASGIRKIVDEHGNWPLETHSIYLGPWAMRHDEVDKPFDGPRDVDLESWTSFPVEGPLVLPVAEWISQQLIQPTYINMSGCVTQIQSFIDLEKFPVTKPGGMRIEMATAAAPNNLYVREFSEPVVITYGCAGSDRTKYSKVARKDDRHMIAWLGHYVLKHPTAAAPTARATVKVATSYLKVLTKQGSLPQEDWRYRTTVKP